MIEGPQNQAPCQGFRCFFWPMRHGGNIHFNFAKFILPRTKAARFPCHSFPSGFWHASWLCMAAMVAGNASIWHLMGRPNRPVTPPLLAKSRTPLRETRGTKARNRPRTPPGPAVRLVFSGNESGRRWSDEAATFLRPFRAHPNQLGSANPLALPLSTVAPPTSPMQPRMPSEWRSREEKNNALVRPGVVWQPKD